MTNTREKNHVALTEKIPELRYFFGRKAEIDEISEFMDSDTYRILALRGIAGIGKTALLSKIVDLYGKKKNIFYWKLYPHSTLRGMLLRFSKFLSEMKTEKLEKCLERASGGKLNAERVLMILEDELSESNLLLVIDDYHNANERVNSFFSSFMDTLDATDAKVVMIGRHIPLFYDKRDVLLKKRVKEMSLGGLDKKGSKELLNYRKIDESHHDKLYSVTGGHPLMLELVTPEATAEATDFIEKEIIDPLSDKERKILELASVFRTSFPLEAVIPEGAGKTMVDGLVEKSLLHRMNENYEEHEMLRGIFYGRLTPDQKISYHRTAAEYYSEADSTDALVEAIYHLIKGYQQSEAARLAIENKEKLLSAEYLTTLLNELGFLEEDEVSGLWPEILLLKGDVSAKLGESEKALRHYWACLEYVEAARPAGERGHLEYLWFGLPREARRVQAKAYFKIGELYSTMSDLDKAREAFENSLKIFQEIEDERAAEVKEALAKLTGT